MVLTFRSSVAVSNRELFKQTKMKKKISNYNLKLANQILLFFNIWTFLAWAISSFYILYYQAEFHTSMNFPLALFCIVIGAAIEILRIYTGYSGNINSDVSFKNSLFQKIKLITKFI